jgi:hypothetical protein
MLVGSFVRLVPALMMAAGLAGSSVGCGTKAKVPAGPETVVLEATTGGGRIAQVPAGKPLLLKPNLQGLPRYDEYHLRILDRSGKPVWQGNFKTATGALIPAQGPGIYIVELYTIPGAMLREYVLEAKAQP